MVNMANYALVLLSCLVYIYLNLAAAHLSM
jgi:hypothetical protein